MAKRLARYSRDVPRDDDEVRQGCKLLVEEMKVLVRVLNRPLGFGCVVARMPWCQFINRGSSKSTSSPFRQ